MNLLNLLPLILAESKTNYVSIWWAIGVGWAFIIIVLALNIGFKRWLSDLLDRWDKF